MLSKSFVSVGSSKLRVLLVLLCAAQLFAPPCGAVNEHSGVVAAGHSAIGKTSTISSALAAERAEESCLSPFLAIGDYKSAERLLRARAIYLERCGPLDERKLLKVWRRLTEIEIILNNYELAEQYALAVLQRLNKQAGSLAVDRLDQLHRLARIQVSRGCMQVAQNNYQRELEQTQALYGINTAAELLPLHDLAMHLEAGGRYQDALCLYGRELTIWQGIVGQAHMSLSSNYIDLGRAAARAQQYQMALDYYGQALRLLQTDSPGNASEIHDVEVAIENIKRKICGARYV